MVNICQLLIVIRVTDVDVELFIVVGVSLGDRIRSGSNYVTNVNSAEVFKQGGS